jgi:hypothetical protein
MQLSQEALMQLQQALPQGGLAAGAWPSEPQPGALAPTSLESHMQHWQRQAAQESSFGHHDRFRGQDPLQSQPWSLSGATEARQQAPPQPPTSLQGWQEQLAAHSGWEAQADEQLPYQQQVWTQTVHRLQQCCKHSHLSDLPSCAGP